MMKTQHLLTTALAITSLGLPLSAQSIQLKYQESFETDGLLDTPARYIVENGNTTVSNTRYFERRQIPSDGVSASGGVYDGDFIWGGRGIDFGTVEGLSANNGRITFPEINISDVGNVYIELAVAEGGAEFEGNNILFLEASVDGGAWQVIGGFRATGTNTSARYFQGDENIITTTDDPRLTTTFSDWRWDLFDSGNTLRLRILIHVNAMAEQYYFDNLRVYGDSSLINLNASLDAQEYNEPAVGGSTPASLTLTMGQAAGTGGQVLNLLLDDAIRAATDLPESVTIPEGQNSLVVPFNVLQDGQFTGQKKLLLAFTSEGLGREQVHLIINNTTPQPNVLITEICNAPPGSLPTHLYGDTNGDGIRDGVQDEFVEIVNFGNEPVDISGYTLADALAVRHVFAEGTILNPMRSIVVFAGGNPVGVFGGAQVQVATQGSFGLNNGGDSVTFAAAYGVTLETVLFDATWAQAPQSSYHRGDTMDTEFVAHYNVPGSNESLFSPGTRPSGEPYGTFANTITIDLSATEVEETGEAVNATVTLSSAARAGGLLVELSSDGWRLQADGSGGMAFVPDEVSLPVTELLIPEGQTSGAFQVVPYNDNILDGDKLVRVVATAGDDILPGLATLTVLDIEPNVFNFAINEVLGEVVGTGRYTNRNGVAEEARDDQFIEVLNLGSDPIDMTGWSLHASSLTDVSGNSLAHVFPVGTIVAGNSAIVVLGGGAMIGEEPNTNLVPANFGNAWVQTAMTASGAQNPNGVNIPPNAPEMGIELRNEHDYVIVRLELTSGLTNQGTSVALSPDGTGTPSLHFGVSPTFESMSPGLQLDNNPFPGSNAGFFGVSGAFPGVMLYNTDGILYVEPVGFLKEMGYPFVYVEATASFWYVHGSMDTELHAYDYGSSQWLALSNTYWPWAYSFDSAQWIDLR